MPIDGILDDYERQAPVAKAGGHRAGHLTSQVGGALSDYMSSSSQVFRGVSDDERRSRVPRASQVGGVLSDYAAASSSVYKGKARDEVAEVNRSSRLIGGVLGDYDAAASKVFTKPVARSEGSGVKVKGSPVGGALSDYDSVALGLYAEDVRQYLIAPRDEKLRTSPRTFAAALLILGISLLLFLGTLFHYTREKTRGSVFPRTNDMHMINEEHSTQLSHQGVTYRLS